MARKCDLQTSSTAVCSPLFNWSSKQSNCNTTVGLTLSQVSIKFKVAIHQATDKFYQIVLVTTGRSALKSMIVMAWIEHGYCNIILFHNFLSIPML